MLLLHDSAWVVRSAGDHLRGGAVCIEGDRITAIGPSAELKRDFDGAQRIDCSGMVLAPGFVNGHNHVYGILCRGLGKQLTTERWLRELVLPVNEALDREDLRNAALLVCADAFRTGTTAMIEQATNIARQHVDAEVEALMQAGMRGGVARGASTVSTIDPRDSGDPDAEVAACDAFLARWAGAGRVQPWVGPSGMFSCDPDTLVRLKRLATERGARYVIHLSETRAQRELAQENGYEGQVDWAHQLGLLDERTIVAHAIWSTEAEIETLARTGATVVHSPTSNMLMGSGITDVVQMLKAGVSVALGADTPAANDAQDMLAEVKATALLQRIKRLDPTVLDAKTCWTLASEAGGALLGLDGEFGRLEPGWAADVVGYRVDGNPCLNPMYDPVDSLVYHGSGRDVCLTLVGGDVVYAGDEFTTIDIEAVTRHIESVVMPKVRRATGRA